MADGARITDLDEGLELALDDFIEFVDRSDTTGSATGRSKKAKLLALLRLISGPLRAPARVVIRTAVTLNTAVVPGAVFDGVTLAADDRVLPIAQSDPGQNGLWVVQASGGPVRPTDFQAGGAAAGAMIPVEAGAYPSSLWICTAESGEDVIGTWPLEFIRVNASNPPFTDDTALLRRTADDTAKLRIVLDAIATGQTRTLTVPDANLDLRNVVQGPVSATASALAAFDGTGGKTLKNSVGTIDADGQIVTPTVVCSLASVTAGPTPALNGKLGNRFDLTLNQNATISFANMATNQAFLLKLGQNGTGGFTVTWPAGIRWSDGTVPQPTTTPSRYDWFGFISSGSGVYDGFVVSRNHSST